MRFRQIDSIYTLFLYCYDSHLHYHNHYCSKVRYFSQHRLVMFTHPEPHQMFYLGRC
jgi:hypothetical protein